MRKYILVCTLLLLAVLESPGQRKVLLGNDSAEEQAELFIYAPADTVAAVPAVLICPGGGYVIKAMDHEGHEIARWLAQNGIVGAVLGYRLPAGRKEIPAEDVASAISYLRTGSTLSGIDPSRIGIMGSSAGGHLAATACVAQGDSISTPDFAILLYPVISSDPDIAHRNSFRALLGDEVTNPGILEKYSLEKQVSPSTPPTLLFLSDDDSGVNPENSVRYYQALKANNIPASLHIFPTGEHGWGFNPDFKYLPVVKTLILDWITSRK